MIFEALDPNYSTIRYVPTATTDAGALVTVNDVLGIQFVEVVQDDVDEEREFTLITKCDCVKVDKNTGEAWTVGDTIYYDDVAKVCTITAGTLKEIGYIKEAAASADATGYISFNGYSDYLKA